MIVGKFGPKVFEVSPYKIYTFNDFQVGSELETSTEDTAKQKQPTTIKGLGLLKSSMELKLLASAGINVDSEANSWFALKDSAAAYPLIICGKALSLNPFLLTSCTESDVVILPIASRPTIVSVTLKLEFLEYIPGRASSSAKKGTSSAKAKKQKQAKGVSSEDISITNPYQTPTTAEKAAVKRPNERMM